MILKPKILLVEDDKAVHYLVKEILGPLVDVFCVESKEQALREIELGDFDLYIIDLILEESSGLDLIKKLKEDGKTNDVSVVIMTGVQDVSVEIEGQKLGIKEYIKKPINPDLFRVIIEKNLSQLANDQDQILRRGHLLMNSLTREISSTEQVVKSVILTPKEFQIFCCLLENSGRVVTRESIMEKFWDYESDALFRNIDMHVSNLRKKVAIFEIEIKTIRSSGYIIEDYSRP